MKFVITYEVKDDELKKIIESLDEKILNGFLKFMFSELLDDVNAKVLEVEMLEN